MKTKIRSMRFLAFGAAIRQVRERHQWTMAVFADSIGVTQATVSRYEAGQQIPRPSVVGAIMALSDENERQAIVGALQADSLLGMSPGLTATEVAASMVRTFPSVRIAEALIDLLGEKARDDGMRRFTVAVSDVLAKCETVDGSISDILHLWAAHAHNPRAAEYLRDALGALRSRLWADHASGPNVGRTET